MGLERTFEGLVLLEFAVYQIFVGVPDRNIVQEKHQIGVISFMQEIPDINTQTEFDNIKDGVFNPTVYTVGGTPKYCSILATQVIMAHIVRDAWRNNTYKIVQQSYLENNSQ